MIWVAVGLCGFGWTWAAWRTGYIYGQRDELRREVREQEQKLRASGQLRDE